VAAVALRPVADIQEIRQWPSQSGTCSLSPRVNSLVAPAAESSRTEAALIRAAIYARISYDPDARGRR
jgi:hypothetical protein